MCFYLLVQLNQLATIGSDFSSLKMWQIYLFLCVAIIAVYRIDGANESVKPEVPLAAAPTISAAPKVMRIYIDTLANDYLAMEKMLWSKIETQQLLVERGILLDEIYREHKRILEANFGQHATIWSLGLQRHAKLFNEILAINTNARNIKEYIFAKENDKVLELAQNAHEQMENSAAEFYKLISDKSFWENIVYNVSEIDVCKRALYYKLICVYFRLPTNSAQRSRQW